MHEEPNWIIKAQHGDQRAFRSLYDANVNALFRFLRQFSGRSEEVEDWVQRSFIKAFEHLDTFDGRSRFSSWLFRIALNEMKTDRRRSQAVQFVKADDEFDLPAATGEQFEWHHTMKTWMTDLDVTKRAVFILYEVEGYSHSEIASMLDIAESSSRTLLMRAKRYLQDRWKKETAL